MAAEGYQLASLTGLRFFAAMAVVMDHLRLYFNPLSESLTIFGYGFTGVSFFFILSGFVLTWSHREEVRPRAFYWNRISRIWPLHIFTMMLAIWAPPLPASEGSSWAAAPFVLSLTQAWIPASPILSAFHGVSWPLSCEAFFTWCSRSYAGSWPHPKCLFAPSLPFLILGMCLARLMKGGWRPPFAAAHAALFLGILNAGLFVTSLLVNGVTDHLPVTISNLVMIPGILVLIAAALMVTCRGRRACFVLPE